MVLELGSRGFAAVLTPGPRVPRAFRLLSGDGRGRIHHRYRVALAALIEQHGIRPRREPGLMLEVGRVARLYLELQSATERLDEAREARISGKGRRPSAATVERLAHQFMTINGSYNTALASLGEQVKSRWLSRGHALRMTDREDDALEAQRLTRARARRQRYRRKARRAARALNSQKPRTDDLSAGTGEQSAGGGPVGNGPLSSGLVPQEPATQEAT
jgi:hypothetical protein